MDNDKPLSENESIALIHTMIQKTQGKLQDSGFHFLLWGWLVFIAALTQYALLRVSPYSAYNGLPWAILMPLGGVVSGIKGYREGKKKKVRTYTGDLLRYVFVAFGVSLFIVLFFMPQMENGWIYAYPMIMMVYGIWLFISGGALQFRPLIIGGVINFGCAVAAFYIHSIELILLLAFAVVSGYIIPGHLLNAKYKREKNEAV